MELVVIGFMSAFVVVPIFLLAFLWAKSQNFYSIVDFIWTSGFAILALTLFVTTAHTLRSNILCAMFLLWSIRLASHLYVRLMGVRAKGKEDPRYEELMENWGAKKERNLFLFFFFQGISVVILATPMFLVTLDRQRTWGVLETLGLLIWIIGFLGEALADKQLKDFISKPENKGEVCQAGLWKYTRHPNYFCEWLMWVGYFVFALPSDSGYIAIISPAIMFFLLTKVTGVPYAEKSSLKSKGDKFRAYQKTTSSFFPIPKKV